MSEDVRTRIIRALSLLLAFVISVLASTLFIQFASSDGLDIFDVARTALIFISTLWLSWGAVQCIIGLLFKPNPSPLLPSDQPLTARTAILVPVYNEDPAATFSRIAAMDMSLQATGQSDKFHFMILSDTRAGDIADREQQWFMRLIETCDGQSRMFYRRRTVNTGKKAGNIEDFITRSGGAYDYALILDADSLMSGDTIVEMARRMQADPKLGLLQTLPRIINAESLFGKAMQFSGNFYSPIFARGIANMQGREGPFWGHNAIVRINAFAETCGLPELTGRPPFGGHILSHDYVEAAMLARGGWSVRVDLDLELSGSFEEGPENLIEHAKRDRRWCQGNLQHARLVNTKGLKFWSRLTFVAGILAYMASLIWASFIILSILASYYAPELNYFPDPYSLFPVFPNDETSKAIALFSGIFGLLFVPKLLIMFRSILTREAKFYGGGTSVVLSVILELIISSLLAPVMLMLQTRSVLQVLMGRDGGWPATERDNGQLSLSESWQASWWIACTGAIAQFVVWRYSPDLNLWLLPITIPMMVSPLLILIGSMKPPSSWNKLLKSPYELTPDPIMLLRDEVLASWQIPSAGSLSADPPLTVPSARIMT